MVEDIIKVFMENFSVVGDSFEYFLAHFSSLLRRCKDYNLVLNWKKYHLMVKKGIILCHKISKKVIDIDKVKNEVIKKLPPLIFFERYSEFWGHAEFYYRFIKDFSDIVNPLCKLLEKKLKFVFDTVCLKAFELLKE